VNMVISFPLSQMIGWISALFTNYVFGSPILAGMFGFLIIIIIGVKLGLGLDSFIVLGIFTTVMFTQYVFPIDLSIIFIIALSIGIVAMGLLKLMKR
jgi:hypothetical protein